MDAAGPTKQAMGVLSNDNGKPLATRVSTSTTGGAIAVYVKGGGEGGDVGNVVMLMMLVLP